MTLLLWILGAGVALTGVWAIVQGQVVLGIVLLVAGIALGPVSQRLLKV